MHTSALLRLPLELRDMIWDHLLVEDVFGTGHSSFESYSQKRTTPCLAIADHPYQSSTQALIVRDHPIMATCKSLFIECYAAYLAKKDFILFTKPYADQYREKCLAFTYWMHRLYIDEESLILVKSVGNVTHDPTVASCSDDTSDADRDDQLFAMEGSVKAALISSTAIASLQPFQKKTVFLTIEHELGHGEQAYILPNQDLSDDGPAMLDHKRESAEEYIDTPAYVLHCIKSTLGKVKSSARQFAMHDIKSVSIRITIGNREMSLGALNEAVAQVTEDHDLRTRSLSARLSEEKTHDDELGVGSAYFDAFMEEREYRLAQRNYYLEARHANIVDLAMRICPPSSETDY